MAKNEHVCCPCCGKESTVHSIFNVMDYRLRTPREHFRLIKCPVCDFRYVNPQPKNLGDYYPKDYYSPYPGIFDKLFSPISNRMFNKIIKAIQKHKGKGSKLLEIGCGSGLFLKKLHDAGFDVTGIDTSENIITYIPDNLRNMVRIGDLKYHKFDDNTYDIIVLKQVFEHFTDLNEEIMEMRRVLKPGGIIYIEVPNYGSFEARLFGKYWYNLEIPRHLHQFTMKTFNSLFAKNGFRVIKVLRHNGVCWFKSPFALFHSLRFYTTHKLKINVVVNKAILTLMFVPMIMSTLLIRLLSSHTPGMDLRIILKKDASSVGERSLQRRKRLNIPIQNVQTVFLKRILKMNRPIQALEIGCGEGYFSEIASNYAQNLIASDISNIIAPSLLRKKNISFQIADGTRLPFSDNTFDLVYSFDVIEHIDDDDAFIRDNWRVLKPGGTLIIATPNRGRLSRRILALLGQETRYPLFLGKDDALGEIIHVREYTRNDIIRLIKRNDIKYDRLSVRGAFFEIYRNVGFERFPSILEGLSKYWFVVLKK